MIDKTLEEVIDQFVDDLKLRVEQITPPVWYEMNIGDIIKILRSKSDGFSAGFIAISYVNILDLIMYLIIFNYRRYH